jgi:hypothetical protein
MGNCVATEAGSVITTATKPQRTTMGDRRVVFMDVAPSASYAAGGDTLDLSQWFKQNVDFVDVEAVTSGGTVYRPEYVRSTSPANGKLKVYSGAGQNNEASGDLHTVAFRVMAIGK